MPTGASKDMDWGQDKMIGTADSKTNMRGMIEHAAMRVADNMEDIAMKDVKIIVMDIEGNMTEHKIKKAKIGFLKLVSTISTKVTQKEYKQAMAEALAIIIMKKMKIIIKDGEAVKVSEENLEAFLDDDGYSPMEYKYRMSLKGGCKPDALAMMESIVKKYEDAENS